MVDFLFYCVYRLFQKLRPTEEPQYGATIVMTLSLTMHSTLVVMELHEYLLRKGLFTLVAVVLYVSCLVVSYLYFIRTKRYVALQKRYAGRYAGWVVYTVACVFTLESVYIALIYMYFRY